MLLRYLINQENINEIKITIYHLQSILSFEFEEYLSLDYTLTNTRVSCYCCNCPDTKKAFRVYFLDDKLLAISYQKSINFRESFIYANAQIKKEFKRYILSLVEDQEDEDEEFLNLDEDTQDVIKRFDY